MFDLSPYRIDTLAISDGAWFSLASWFKEGKRRIAADSEPALRVAAQSCDRFTLAWNELVVPVEDPKERLDRVKQAMAKGLITGWRGLAPDGEEVPYSEERCLALLRDKELPDLQELAWSASRDMDCFRKKVEARLGN